jgi:A/G-specific adenine glycosylase
MRKPFIPSTRIRRRLLQWFEKNGRDLPWRRTRDPYAIWISEVMLQQTQVKTVLPYYRRFLKTFPTVRHLARADLSRVLKMWEGLGYYSRARNLHLASKMVIKNHQGEIPDTLKDLRRLPGIGRSTAGALLSFGFDKSAPILDGNARRVICRIFAISDSPLKGKTEVLLWQIAESLTPRVGSNPFNQAIMDLGSMVCIPKNPQCPRCPIQSHCKGYLSGDPERYPTKKPKKKIPQFTAVSAVIQKDGNVLLKRRPPRGLLGGLWEFPNWKIEEKRSSRLMLKKHIENELGMNVQVKESIGEFHHTYTHFKLTLLVYECQPLEGNEDRKWFSPRRLPSLPMSRIHRKIADTVLLRKETRASSIGNGNDARLDNER